MVTTTSSPNPPSTSTIPIPVIHVSHLPTAASFYASLTKVLGLQFLSAGSGSAACLHFGYLDQGRSVVVFSLKGNPHPILSRTIISAPSPNSIQEFHRKSEILHPGDSQNTYQVLEEDEGEEEFRAQTRDLDGNILEARFVCTDAQNLHIGAGEVEETERDIEKEREVERELRRERERERERKEEKEKEKMFKGIDRMMGRGGGDERDVSKDQRRVMEWQENVARSATFEDPDVESPSEDEESDSPHPRTVRTRRADTFPRSIRREQTYPPTSGSAAKEQNTSTNFTGKAVIGTIIGAAAGAAFAYSMVRSESPPPMAAGPNSRRANAYGTSAPTRSGNYTHSPTSPNARSGERVIVPERSYPTNRDREREQPRYVQYTIAQPKPLARIEEKSYVSTRSRSSTVPKPKYRQRSASVSVSSGSRSKGYYVVEKQHRPLAILPAKTSSHSGGRDRDRERSHHANNSNTSNERRRDSGGGRERRTSAPTITVTETTEREERERLGRRDRDRNLDTMRPEESTSRSISRERVPVFKAPSPPPAASYVSSTTIKDAAPRERARSHVAGGGGRDSYDRGERERESHVSHRSRRDSESHVSHRSRRDSAPRDDLPSRSRRDSHPDDRRSEYTTTSRPPMVNIPLPREYTGEYSSRPVNIPLNHGSVPHHGSVPRGEPGFGGRERSGSEYGAGSRPPMVNIPLPREYSGEYSRPVNIPIPREYSGEYSRPVNIPIPREYENYARAAPGAGNAPRSMAAGGGYSGSGRGGYGGGGGAYDGIYAASVAPSDSVSSVGSKRERERLRERMGVRAGGGGGGYSGGMGGGW